MVGAVGGVFAACFAALLFSEYRTVIIPHLHFPSKKACPHLMHEICFVFQMHEQSVLVTDLMQCRASEPAIEKERRKLRKLELARFKQFRKSVLDKLKRNAIRQKKRTLEPRKVSQSALFCKTFVLV